MDKTLLFKQQERIRFAGQITGVEGYLESAAIGLLAGMFFSNETLGTEPQIPPKNTALASLLSHITNAGHQGQSPTFKGHREKKGSFRESTK